MSIDGLNYPALADLDADRLAAIEESLKAVLSEYNPDMDLRRGVVKDLVLHSRALLAAQNEKAILDALNGGSLAELAADPEAAPEGSVDRVLGNYGLVRREAAKAVGSIVIVLTAQTPVVIPSGSVFDVGGVEFVTDRVYAARLNEAQVIGPGDKLLVATGSNYYFVVGVEASETGANGNVRQGTVATPEVEPVNFSQAYANVDFTGGADAESNTALLARQQAGLAVRAWSTRPSIEAVVRDAKVEESTLNDDGTTTVTEVAQFPELVSLSVVGAGDAEMLRDKHSLWPVAAGGRADLYARTATTYETRRVTLTASLLSKVGAVGTWQLGIGRDDAPGYYEVVKVLLTTQDSSSSGFSVASETRSLDVTGDGWKPDIPEVAEGVYSRYQASVITFVDTVTNATALAISSTKEYDVVVRVMPQVDELQDFWNDVSRRPTMGDVLVKAPIPCFVAVALTLSVARGATVSVTDIQQELAGVINGLSFTAKLPASLLSQALHTLLGTSLVSVSGLSLSGRILKPDQSVTYLSSSVELTLPDDPENMVSPRTVAFLTEPDSVTVTLTVVDTTSR